MAGLVPAIHALFAKTERRGCPRRQVYAACASLAASAGMTEFGDDMSDTKDKPEAPPIRPTVNDVNRPFWEGCRRGQLLVQRCGHCAHLRYPAAIVCPEC